MDEVKAGWYRHFKGGEYQVIGVATQTETKELLVVYLDAEGQLWARPREMFQETLLSNGRGLLRYEFIGEARSEPPTLRRHERQQPGEQLE